MTIVGIQVGVCCKIELLSLTHAPLMEGCIVLE